MNARKQARLRTTAIHEAGHAVACHFSRFARKTKLVTIVPSGDARGHTLMVGRLSEATPIARVIDEVTVLLAGAAAERLILGRSSHVGASGDYATATDFALKFTGSPDQATAFIQWCGVRARDSVALRRKAVEAVADTLLAERTLNRWRLIEVIDQAYGLTPLKLSPMAIRTLTADRRPRRVNVQVAPADMEPRTVLVEVEPVRVEPKTVSVQLVPSQQPPRRRR